jgi:nitroimidazol reductase NimA-like FMN-containing flavoprotein (pyridoxamine 5'-phosphate oxidase superfamily)/N-acetylglutamate synthase-like GNAT family acetyltransferase
MRKEIFRMTRAEGVALLERAPFVRVATTTSRGEPVLRAVNAATLDGTLVFHGAPAGEKMDAVGREAVVSAEEVVASIPSYFVDPERACPATTLYRSVQVHGTLDRVDDPRTKARALDALLRKHQPEGGFVPIAHDHPLYEKTLASLLVLAVNLERLDGKAKLGQNRTPAEQRRMVESLWRRGAPGDAAAAFAVVAANPTTERPGFLRAPGGIVLDAGAGRADAEACAALLEGTYWNDRFSLEEIVSAHLGSSAWLVARDATGVVASARAISDGAKYAWIYDDVVAPAWRGRGAGDAVVRLLLDHPAVRPARFVRLGTKDAMAFYAKMGFVDVTALPPRPYRATDMVLVR